MQTRQNVEKMAKCGDFLSGARGNAKLKINFFALSPDFGHLSTISGIFWDVHVGV